VVVGEDGVVIDGGRGGQCVDAVVFGSQIVGVGGGLFLKQAGKLQDFVELVIVVVVVVVARSNIPLFS
jgi:hypothetical protein